MNAKFLQRAGHGKLRNRHGEVMDKLWTNHGQIFGTVCGNPDSSGEIYLGVNGPFLIVCGVIYLSRKPKKIHVFLLC